MGIVLQLMTIWSLIAALDSIAVGAISNATDVRTVGEPDSLKEMIDFFGKIGKDGTIRANVVNELEKKLSENFKLQAFGDKDFKKNLSSVFDKINELRKGLLNHPEYYGIFAGIADFENDEKCFDQLVHWLPKLRSMLWFPYFKTTTECFGIGGQDWGDNIRVGGGSNSLLNKWLSDQLSKQSHSGILKRGYTASDLKTDLFGASQADSLGVQFYAGGPLDYAQFGLFLLDGTWSNANLASVTLFLRGLCRTVQNDTWSSIRNKDKYSQLQRKCANLSTELDSLYEHLWPLFNPMTVEEEEGDDDVTSKKRQKADSHYNVYVDKLKIEKIDVYVTWLTNNLSSVILSLKEMHKDSSNWSKEDFDSARSIGPFKYGFVFKDKKWDGGAIYYDLNEPVTKVSEILLEMLKSLNPEAARQLKEKWDKENEAEKKRNQVTRRSRSKHTEHGNPSNIPLVPSTPIKELSREHPSPAPSAPTRSAESYERPSAEPTHGRKGSDLTSSTKQTYEEAEGSHSEGSDHSDPSRWDTHSLSHKPSFASFPSVILASAVVVTSALL